MLSVKLNAVIIFFVQCCIHEYDFFFMNTVLLDSYLTPYQTESCSVWNQLQTSKTDGYSTTASALVLTFTELQKLVDYLSNYCNSNGLWNGKKKLCVDMQHFEVFL